MVSQALYVSVPLRLVNVLQIFRSPPPRLSILASPRSRVQDVIAIALKLAHDMIGKQHERTGRCTLIIVTFYS
jgi:hypothetical protein